MWKVRAASSGGARDRTTLGAQLVKKRAYGS